MLVRTRGFARVLAPTLVFLQSAAFAAGPPRAAAVVAGASKLEAGERQALARALLEALDDVPGVAALKTPALRDALSPAPEAIGPSAEAFAAARAAGNLRETNVAVAASIYERALTLVFESVGGTAARRWLDTHGAHAESALKTAGRMTPALAARLSNWRTAAPQGPIASFTLRVVPDGARVYLDGWPMGSGGTLALRHVDGEHDLRVERDGYAPHVARVRFIAGAPGQLEVKLAVAPSDGTEDLRALAAALVAAPASAGTLAPFAKKLCERLDVGLLYVASPDDGGALVRLYDAEAEAFVGASPVAGTDAVTLRRGLRALLDLRGAGERLADTADAPKKKKARPFHEAFWKKWWVWAAVLGGAAAVTGAVYLSRQSTGDGNLTILLRRAK